MNMPDEKALRHLNVSLNLDALWIPFTANRQFKAAPRLLVSAKDMHYQTHDGRKVLDGIAGLRDDAARGQVLVLSVHRVMAHATLTSS